MSENMFEKRLQLANQAIAHEEPERILFPRAYACYYSYTF